MIVRMALSLRATSDTSHRSSNSCVGLNTLATPSRLPGIRPRCRVSSSSRVILFGLHRSAVPSSVHYHKVYAMEPHRETRIPHLTPKHSYLQHRDHSLVKVPADQNVQGRPRSAWVWECDKGSQITVGTSCAYLGSLVMVPGACTWMQLGL